MFERDEREPVRLMISSAKEAASARVNPPPIWNTLLLSLACILKINNLGDGEKKLLQRKQGIRFLIKSWEREILRIANVSFISTRLIPQSVHNDRSRMIFCNLRNGLQLTSTIIHRFRWIFRWEMVAHQKDGKKVGDEVCESHRN